MEPLALDHRVGRDVSSNHRRSASAMKKVTFPTRFSKHQPLLWIRRHPVTLAFLLAALGPLLAVWMTQRANDEDLRRATAVLRANDCARSYTNISIAHVSYRLDAVIYNRVARAIEQDTDVKRTLVAASRAKVALSNAVRNLIPDCEAELGKLNELGISFPHVSDAPPPTKPPVNVPRIVRELDESLDRDTSGVVPGGNGSPTRTAPRRVTPPTPRRPAPRRPAPSPSSPSPAPAPESAPEPPVTTKPPTTTRPRPPVVPPGPPVVPPVVPPVTIPPIPLPLPDPLPSVTLPGVEVTPPTVESPDDNTPPANPPPDVTLPELPLVPEVLDALKLF